jgi:hypothetical protein
MPTARTGTILLAPKWRAGETFTAIGKYTWPDSVVTADTITWAGLFPAGGVTVVDAKLTSVELDTNASPSATVIVGTVADDNGLIKSFIGGVNTTGNTQINANANGDLLATSLSAATDVVLTVGGTVATAASAGDTFVYVTYHCSGLA